MGKAIESGILSADGITTPCCCNNGCQDAVGASCCCGPDTDYGVTTRPENTAVSSNMFAECGPMTITDFLKLFQVRNIGTPTEPIWVIYTSLGLFTSGDLYAAQVNTEKIVGLDSDKMWELLAAATNEPINQTHIPIISVSKIDGLGTLALKSEISTADISDLDAYMETESGEIILEARSVIQQTATEILATVAENKITSDGQYQELLSALTVQAGQIATKVSQTTYDTDKQASETRFSTIEQTASQIQSTVAANKESADGSISSLQSQITQQAGLIATKVSQTDYAADNTTRETRFSTIEQTAEGLTTRVADIEEEFGEGGRITEAETSIEQNAQAIALKASQSSVDTLSGQVQQNAAAIVIANNQIATKVSQSAYDTDKQSAESRMSLIEQDAIGIHQSVSGLDGKIDTKAQDLTTYIETIEGDLQRQIDGAIETYKAEGAPTLNNYPASEWDQSEYDAHVGDLYYDTATGYAYRFAESSGVYSWELIRDTGITEAIATANDKGKIFITQPVPPYKVGDLWAQGHKSTNDGALYRCIVSRDSGSFDASDWEIAYDYESIKISRANFDIFSNLILGTVAQYDASGNITSATWSQFQQGLGGISLMVFGQNGGFRQTGIDIADHTVTIMADNFVLKNTNGTRTLSLAVDGNGLPLIAASNLEINGIFSTTPGSTWMTLRGNILSTAQGYADSAEGNANNYADSVGATTLQSSKDYFNNNVLPGINSSISGLSTRMGTAETDISNLATRVADAEGGLSDLGYLAAALLDGSTTVAGGLILSSLIQLGSNTGSGDAWQVWSGINGVYNSSAYGGGIAAWYGGDMLDRYYSDNTDANRAAKTLFRQDGSGYIASNNLWWGASGDLHINGSTIIDQSGNVTLSNIAQIVAQLSSWFEVVTETRGGTQFSYLKLNTSSTGLRGFATDGFISAFGASDTGGGGGGGIDLSAMWTNLQINESGVTGYGLQIDYHHLPTIAYNGNSGFVTSAAWSKTGSTNYLTLTRRALTASDIPSLTTSKISDLETWIDGKDFLTGNETITLSGVVSGSGTTTITTAIADGTITNAMLAGSIANGKLANSAITINGSSTALGGSFNTASITAGTAGTSSATSGLSIAIPYVTLNKYGIVTAYGTHTHSISKANITSAIGSTTYAPYNSAGYLPLSGGTMTGDIKMTAGKYITTADGSTIIGVTAQGVFYIGEPQGEWSTNIAGEGDLLHDTGGSLAVILDQENFDTYALPLAGGVMTGPISGVTYLSVNRAAQTTYRLDVNGATRLGGALTVSGATTFNNNVTVDSTSSITLGNGVLTWDAQNSAWKLTGNLYATGFISAFGASDTGGGGGGIDLSAMWANLQVNESGTTGYNLQINPGHLTTALGTYVNGFTTTGSGNAITAVSKDGSTLTFTKGSTFALASRTVTGTGYLTGGGALSANRTIDIASTYKGYIDEGHTAYGWGDHAQAGYLTGITSSMVTTALGFTPANSTALGNYLPLSGGTMTGDLNLKYGSNLYVKFDVDTSRVRNGLIFLDTSGTSIGRLTMHNTAKAIYINATGASSLQSDTVGKYSLKIGENSLTYNTYSIYHTNNLTQSVITGLIGSSTYAPYNADGYLPLSGGALTGDLTAPKFIKTGGTSSQFLKADGSVDSNTYMTTDTDQTITGAKTFADAGAALLGADQYKINSSISYAYPATAWNAWHDHFAFLINHTIQDVQVTTDGSTWTASSKNLKPLFIHKENTFVQILDAADRAFRFTLYSSGSFHVSQIRWLSFGTGYSNPFSSFTLKAECSADNSTWTAWGEHTVTAGTTPYCMKLGALPGNQKYLRFTFTKTSNLTTGTVRLCAFSGLTNRKGDQGLGKENSYPFSWDTGVNLLPLTAGVSTLGTESYRWHTVYGETGNFSGITSKLMYFRQASATSNAGYIGLGSSSNNDISLVNYGANGLSFWTNSSFRMKIDSEGNVGIGTDSPASKLDVAGDMRVIATGSEFAKFLVYPTNPYGIVFSSETNGTMNIQSRREASAQYFNLVLNPLGGNVGIGTTSPTYKLDVAGSIRATGTVFAPGYGVEASSNQARLSATGWYRVWTYNAKDTTGNHVLLYIEKTFSNSAGESYTVDITIAPNGAVTLTQIGGTTQSPSVQNITKVRYNYTYNTAGALAIDIYYSGTAANDVRVYGFCGKGNFQAPAAVTTTYSGSKELELYRDTLHTSGNIVADGYISAFGVSETGGSGGGGINLAAMWANLQVNDSDTTGYGLQIHPGHLTTALGTYVNAITTAGSGNVVTGISKSGQTLTVTYGSGSGGGGLSIIDLDDNGTTTAGTWLASSSAISAYTDGLMVRYKLTKAGAATTTLNINGLGAKTVYRFNSTKLTTHYSVGSYVILIYNTSLNSGCWITVDGYDSNSDNYVRQYVASNDNEYSLLARYATTSVSSYEANYARFANAVTLNPSKGSISATQFYQNGNRVPNITVSSSAPSASDGEVGDVWIQV